MTQELPSSDQPPESKKKPEASMTAAETANIAQAKAEHRASLAENETVDNHNTELAEIVMDYWDQAESGPTCFGVPVSQDMVPDKVVACLVQIEADYEIDVVASLNSGDFTPDEIGEFLHDELITRRDSEQEEFENVETSEIKADVTAYAQVLEELKGKSNTEQIPLLANDPRVPEAERAKLQAFARILAISENVPADAAIVRQRINQIDLSQGVPNAASFARSFIFDSPHNPSGISAATQAAIATELGITRHGVPLPKDADDLQTALREGRGVERETQIRRVQDPITGEWREEEVVVSERTLPFTEGDPMLVSLNPLVEAFPTSPGGSTHQVVGAVSGADPIRFTVNIPKNGAFPTGDIHYLFNKGLMTANQHNHGLRGALEYLSTGVDGTLPISTNPERGAIGERDILQKQFEVFHGLNFPLAGRFATQGELGAARPEMRWLAIDGDFGVTNQMDPAQTVVLMKAVFGSSQGDIMDNLSRAGAVINTGGAETPSIQNLYKALYPEDAELGYPRLRGIIGDEDMKALGLSQI